MIAPFIKWTGGGKRQLVGTLRPIIEARLAEGGTYWEPFLGGGAVALSLASEIPVHASDACAELIEAWDVVRKQPYRLISTLRAMGEMHSKAYYYEVRGATYDTAVMRAARFIYLNKMGFNGLYRKNKSGGFNVPLGRGKITAIPDTSTIIPVYDRVRDWRLEALDFEDFLEDPRWRPSEGDVIFADPPYDGTHDYSSGFSESDQRRLAACLRRAARRGVGVVATNADTPLVRRAYAWAIVRDITEQRRISCDSANRDAASCVLVTR